MKRIMVLLIVFLLILAPAGCSGKPSLVSTDWVPVLSTPKANIELGMTKDEVVSILGGEGQMIWNGSVLMYENASYSLVESYMNQQNWQYLARICYNNQVVEGFMTGFGEEFSFNGIHYGTPYNDVITALKANTLVDNKVNRDINKEAYYYFVLDDNGCLALIPPGLNQDQLADANEGSEAYTAEDLARYQDKDIYRVVMMVETNISESTLYVRSVYMDKYSEPATQ